MVESGGTFNHTVSMNDPNGNERFRIQLETRRTDLLALTEEGERAEQTVELDQQRVGRLSRMDALQQQAMAKESGRRRQVELKRIAAALARIDEDDYGYCFRCGEDIPPARLNIDPACTLCVECAAKAER